MLPEDKKVIYGTEGENVVAYGRLPSPLIRLQFANIIVRGKISVPLNQFACSHKIDCSFKTNEKHVTY